MTTIEDCFREKMLRRVEPSMEKANESLNLASSYLEEARQVADVGARYNSEGRGLDPEAFGVIADWLNGQARR